MKKIDFGQTITILANVGVIAGIGFLGYELRQNNRFLELQERYTFMQNVTGFNEFTASSDEIAGLLYRSSDGSPYSPVEIEQFRRCQVFGSLWRRWQWEFENLAIQPSDPLASGWRSFWVDANPGDCWDPNRGDYPADFVQFIDEHVVN